MKKNLETERMFLEPLTIAHTDEMYVLLQDKNIFKYIPTTPPTNIDELKKRFSKLQLRHSPDKKELWLNWVLRLKSEGFLVGKIEATITANNTVHIAYELSSTSWGKGFANEGCREILENLKKLYSIKTV